MRKQPRLFFTPEEKSKELEDVLREVKEQVKKYKYAKRKGVLRKVTPGDSSSLFNV